MIGLPKTTEVNRHLPKKALFDKSCMKSADRREFDKEIRKLTIIHEISPDTVNIAAGVSVRAFYVMLVNLYREDCSNNNILLLSKHIPQNVLFVLEYNGYASIAVYRADNVIRSDLLPINEWNIELFGYDLDAVWENTIAMIGNINVTDDKTLDEQIRADKERSELLLRIERLEAQAQKEKQPRRKWELVQEIKNLKLQTEVRTC